jgi:hypothetical protein
MQQFGAASVYGVDGTITYSGQAVLSIPDNIDTESSASIDEFMSGINQLLGFYKTNERLGITITLVPKADTQANAKTALKMPVGPCKVTISGCSEDDGSDIRHVNGDYIYVQGASKAKVRGQNTFRLPIFRPLDVPDQYKVGGQITTAAVTAYITALVTPAA